VPQKLQKLIPQNLAYSLETQKLVPQKEKALNRKNFFFKMHHFRGNESQKFLPCGVYRTLFGTSKINPKKKKNGIESRS